MESNGLEKRRVCLGMPGYSGMTGGAARGFFMATSGKVRIGGRAVALEIERQWADGSLLGNNFNRLWTWALNEHVGDGPPVDYFGMIHADVEPEMWWLDKMIVEMERCDYDVISAVIPLKDLHGITSTALARPDGDPWNPLCRLTMKEVYDKLPPTFDQSHTGHPLLLNTGLWVCRFSKLAEHGLHFTINDRIIFDQKRNQFIAEVESEDWNFSRLCHELGLRLAATRKIDLNHSGSLSFPNTNPWGEQFFDRALVNESVLKDHDGWKFPHDVEGWLSFHEGEALAELARGKRVLEIGSYCGRSTICMAQTADYVTAIDPHDGSGTPRPQNTLQTMKKNLARYKIDNVAIEHPNNFDPYEYIPFDFAFIDGAHDCESVTSDVAKVLNCLKPDGLIGFHDYRSQPGEFDGRWDPGVNQAVDSLIAEGGELLERHETLAVVRPPKLRNSEPSVQSDNSEVLV